MEARNVRLREFFISEGTLQEPPPLLLISWPGAALDNQVQTHGSTPKNAKIYLELKPVQVFLSYAQFDEPFAKALSSELSRRGLSVWSPWTELLPGENPWLRIGEALQKSKAMVVLVSPESVNSDNVRREIEYALGNEKYEGRLFPVEVRPTRDIPWILRKFKGFKFRDGRFNAVKFGESIANALSQLA